MIFTDDFEQFIREPMKHRDKLIKWKARRKFLKTHQKMQSVTKQSEVWAVHSETSDNPLSSSSEEIVVSSPIRYKPEMKAFNSATTPLLSQENTNKLLKPDSETKAQVIVENLNKHTYRLQPDLANDVIKDAYINGKKQGMTDFMTIMHAYGLTEEKIQEPLDKGKLD